MTETKTARIFEEPTGLYYVCSNDLDYFDARGRGFLTKVDALRAAAAAGYTHATGSGTYWSGVKAIPARYRDNY